MNKKNYLKKTILYFSVALLTFFSFIPFYIMAIMGTYKNEELYTGIKLLPGNYLSGNWNSVFSQNFLVFYKNSTIISVFATVGGVFICSMAGYAFSKFKFRFRNFLFFIILSTLMIPSNLGLVGLLMEMKWFGLINTHLSLILPVMANAFGLFWLTQYIGSAIPDQLLESAEIDGAGFFRTFLRIVMPNIKPGLVTIFLLIFLQSWNNYLGPLVLINKEELYTVTLGVSMLRNLYHTDFAARILALAISTLPVLIMFSIGSKYLIKGLMVGSIKG